MSQNIFVASYPCGNTAALAFAASCEPWPAVLIQPLDRLLAALANPVHGPHVSSYMRRGLAKSDDRDTR
jgi:hypothetical protein